MFVVNILKLWFELPPKMEDILHMHLQWSTKALATVVYAAFVADQRKLTTIP